MAKNLHEYVWSRPVEENFGAGQEEQSMVSLSEIKITPRDEQVLKLLVEGCSNKEIASLLSLSLETVRTHLRHIYEKLHVHSRTEALARYFER